MLSTSRLKGNETFEEAYTSIPERDDIQYRYLYTQDGEQVDQFQYSVNNGESWKIKQLKTNKSGQFILPELYSKKKLEKTSSIYEMFTKPTHAGSDAINSWLIGDIDGCNIMNDEYNIQGLIISSIFDPMPKFYISFDRVACTNQFGSLGRNNASMYLDMNYFMNNRTQEDKDKLNTLITAEVNKRIEESQKVYKKLASVHLDDTKINKMFEMLTIDKVAKTNKDKYHQAELELANYRHAYDVDDNQNYQNTLFGFVNACTRHRTRTKDNPLDIIKPVLPASVIDDPCNFDYLCRAAVLQNV